MEVFENDDEGYLAWIATNPDGHVVNTTRPPSEDYLKLHSARCHTIGGTPAHGEAWTRGQYMKVCAATIEELAQWARDQFGEGVELDECRICF